MVGKKNIWKNNNGKNCRIYMNNLVGIRHSNKVKIK